MCLCFSFFVLGAFSSTFGMFWLIGNMTSCDFCLISSRVSVPSTAPPSSEYQALQSKVICEPQCQALCNPLASLLTNKHKKLRKPNLQMDFQALNVLNRFNTEIPNVILQFFTPLPGLALGSLYCHIKQPVIMIERMKKKMMPRLIHFSFILKVRFDSTGTAGVKI